MMFLYSSSVTALLIVFATVVFMLLWRRFGPYLIVVNLSAVVISAILSSVLRTDISDSYGNHYDLSVLFPSAGLLFATIVEDLVRFSATRVARRYGVNLIAHTILYSLLITVGEIATTSTGFVHALKVFVGNNSIHHINTTSTLFILLVAIIAKLTAQLSITAFALLSTIARSWVLPIAVAGHAGYNLLQAVLSNGRYPVSGNEIVQQLGSSIGFSVICAVALLLLRIRFGFDMETCHSNKVSPLAGPCL